MRPKLLSVRDRMSSALHGAWTSLLSLGFSRHCSGRGLLPFSPTVVVSRLLRARISCSSAGGCTRIFCMRRPSQPCAPVTNGVAVSTLPETSASAPLVFPPTGCMLKPVSQLSWRKTHAFLHAYLCHFWMPAHQNPGEDRRAWSQNLNTLVSCIFCFHLILIFLECACSKRLGN